MPLLAHGVDLVHCPRIERIWRDHGELFLARVYTPAERAYCLTGKTPVTRLAGRFAAKEAVLKALGTGWRGGILWTDVETLADALGKPIVTLAGRTQTLAKQMGLREWTISISHAGEYAIASVVACGD